MSDHESLKADAEDARLGDEYERQKYSYLDESHCHRPCPVCGICTICDPHLHVGRNNERDRVFTVVSDC